MGSQSRNWTWSTELVMQDLVAKEEDPFLFPSQLPPLDFSGYSALDWQCELPMQESFFEATPLMESLPTDPLFSRLDIEQTPSVAQEAMHGGYGNNEFGVLWDDMSAGIAHERQTLLLCDSYSTGDNREKRIDEEKINKRRREEKISSSKMLSREIISQYFYMPITQAARELNIGLTLLKKRCRELGIRRWPHRKLMSLQTLIKNVQELEKDEGEAGEGKLRDAVEILEQERKLMEEMPDMQLEDKTKRLRQACFKANYKKRKLMGMDSQSSSSSNRGSWNATFNCGTSVEEDEELKSLLSDSFSSSSLMII